MLKDIKKIKLEEFEKNVDRTEIDEINQKFADLSDEKLKLEAYLRHGGKVSKWLKKNVIAKQKIKRVQEIEVELKKLSEERIEADNKIRTKKDRIANATTFSEFGLDFASAISFLQEHGYPVILEEEDLQIDDIKPTKGINKLSDFVLVRKDKHPPMHSVLEPSGTGRGHDFVLSMDIKGKEYEYKYPSSRNTVHFAVNGEVGDHIYGNWHDCKYAIIMPYIDAPREKMVETRPEDTFFEGSVPLSKDAIILCPKGEGKKIKEDNPGVTVMEYDGSNVTGYAQKLVAFLGYKAEKVLDGGWSERDDYHKYLQVMEENGLSDLLKSHAMSENKFEVTRKEAISHLIGILNAIKENNIIQNHEDIIAVAHDAYYNIIGVMNFENPDLFPRLAEAGYPMPEDVLEIFKLLDDEEFQNYMRSVKDLDYEAYYNDLRSRGFTFITPSTFARNALRSYMVREDNKDMYETICNLLQEIRNCSWDTSKRQKAIERLKVTIFVNEIGKQLISELENEEEAKFTM